MTFFFLILTYPMNEPMGVLAAPTMTTSLRPLTPLEEDLIDLEVEKPRDSCRPHSVAAILM